MGSSLWARSANCYGRRIPRCGRPKGRTAEAIARRGCRSRSTIVTAFQSVLTFTGGRAPSRPSWSYVAAVRSAGSWKRYANEPRVQLVVLRKLAESGRAVATRGVATRLFAPRRGEAMGSRALPDALLEDPQILAHGPRPLVWYDKLLITQVLRPADERRVLHAEERRPPASRRRSGEAPSTAVRRGGDLARRGGARPRHGSSSRCDGGGASASCPASPRRARANTSPISSRPRTASRPD